MSFSSLSTCAICANAASISSCEGCKRKFCLPCFTQHRNELSLALDDLVNRRNELVQTMNNQLPSNNSTDECSCFNTINQWRNEMHANIDRIAATARDNVRQILSEGSQHVQTELNQISNELQQRQKTGGYVEDDLDRLRRQLNRLNDLVSDCNKQIHINTDISKTIAWDSLIFVVSKKESSPSPPPAYTPSNPVLQNSNQQKYFVPTSMYHRNPNSNISTPPPVHNSRTSYAPPSPSVHESRMYSDVSTPTSMSQLNNGYRPFSRNTSFDIGYQRSIPVNRNSGLRTFQCIGCKTVNNVSSSGPSICTVCRCPANF